MPKSTEKLIKAAQECFFQHGYDAANVSLIGRYANLSRPTIYKNFSSKEDLFRAVVQNHFEEHQAELMAYADSDKDFWNDTEQLALGRCEGIFDEIASNIIRSELIHISQSLCQDLLQKETYKVQNVIKARLKREIAQNNLSIEHMNLTIEQFCQVIEAVPIGVAYSTMEDNTIELLKNMFVVFRASTTTPAQ